MCLSSLFRRSCNMQHGPAVRFTRPHDPSDNAHHSIIEINGRIRIQTMNNIQGNKHTGTDHTDG